MYFIGSVVSGFVYNKYSIWLDIELAAAEAMEKLKIIPRGVVKKVKSKAKINVKPEDDGKLPFSILKRAGIKPKPRAPRKPRRR